MPERECPSCTRSMSTGRLGPIPLDLCMQCGGVWFDCGELSQVVSAGSQIVRRLVSGLPPAPPTAPFRGNPKCPVCHVPLEGTEYASMPGVAVESCAFCEGVFASRTTLDRLVACLEGASRWDQVVASAKPASTAGAPVSGVPAGAPPPPNRPAEGHPCPSCGELNAARSSCWACGKPLLEPVVGTCPGCRGNMRRLDSQGVTFNACEGCAGVYIHPGRLNDLLRQPQAQVESAVLRQLERFGPGSGRATSAPACAECRTSMVAATLGTLSPKPIPSCPRCFSLFLSRERLAEILAGRWRAQRPAAPAPQATGELSGDVLLAQGLADRLAKARLIRTWRGLFGVSPSTGASYLAMRFEATGRTTILRLPTEPGPAQVTASVAADTHWAE